ncbi:MAG: TRAP transporter substrate-binding protein [Rhodospirillales bacterium]|nr:TRAP transporter substrate-binding protein [Rhodospirillales bacterium]
MSIIKSIKILMAGVLTAGLTIAAVPADAQTYRLKIGSEVNASHPVGESLTFFKQRVEELSKGEMKIAVFPGATIGKARNMVEMAQLGTLDMATIAAGVVSNFVPALDFFSLPFLWKDGYHLQRAVDGPLGKILDVEMEKAGLISLGFTTSGSRQLYTNKVIKSIDDIKGMKIRTMKVPQIIETWKALGAIPMPVAFSETYQALQTGLVDGAESSFLSWISRKHYEQAKFGYRINYIDSGRVYFLSKVTAEKIGPANVAILKQAAKETIKKKVLEEYYSRDKAAGKTAAKFGAKVIELDIAPFKAAVKSVYDKFVPTLGPKVIELVNNAK